MGKKKSSALISTGPSSPSKQIESQITAINPTTSHAASNVTFSSSVTGPHSLTESASNSSGDKELVDNQSKLVHDSEEVSYLYVPHCVLFFCVQAKVGPIFKRISSSHNSVQKVTRYDRGCTSFFRDGSFRKLIDCKCKKKYHVHVSEDDELVEQMSILFKQGSKDIPPTGVTQRYLNFINKNELVNFEQGYKEWLVRMTHTPPIDIPLLYLTTDQKKYHY